MARVGRNASCGLPPPWSPRPRAEKRDNGSSMAAQLSRPWSNSSPVGEGGEESRMMKEEREGKKKREREEKAKGREGRWGEGRKSPCVVCVYNYFNLQALTTAMDGWEGGRVRGRERRERRERRKVRGRGRKERREGEDKIKPNGVLIPVLLACFPSMPSSVCERKWKIAQTNHTHAGIGGRTIPRSLLVV